MEQPSINFPDWHHEMQRNVQAREAAQELKQPWWDPPLDLNGEPFKPNMPVLDVIDPSKIGVILQGNRYWL